MFKFKLTYVALAAALTSTCAIANTTIYTHRTGTTIVNIETPNAAGVSHNMYSVFNVNSKGLILNNSNENVNHSSLGSIGGNNNLSQGAASVILNEVTSNKSSALNGFIEVNGQRADVVIANPNGISCSGCSFINTNKAILTTGIPTLDSTTGAIKSYNVTGGNITVDAYGMNARENYVALLADTINLNGTVNAYNAMISTGNFTYDNTTGSVTSHGKRASLIQTLMPEYSLDIASIGGVKANSITMIGNNLGFGVRNKGNIESNYTLVMASNGSLINEGSIKGNGYVTQMVSGGELKNTGTITTNNTAILNSMGTLTNTGSINNTAQMSVSSTGNMENTGQINATNLLAVGTGGNLTTTYGSWLGSNGQMSVTASGNVTHGGSMRANNTTVTFAGNKLDVTGDIHGYQNALVQASNNGTWTGGEINNSGTISGGNVTLTTNGSLITNYGSVLSATDSLNTRSYWLNNGGSLGSSNATVNINNYVTNLTGNITGRSVAISTAQDMLNQGWIRSYGDLSINTAGKNLTNRGTITASGTMTLSAKQVVNGGYRCGFMNLKTCEAGTLSANKLILNSSHQYASNMGGTQNFKASEIHTNR